MADKARRRLPLVALVRRAVGRPYLLMAAVVLVLGHGYPDASAAFWYQLALTSTLAGNLTLVGSVANLIVAEAAAKEGVHVGFLDYLRVGVPLTLVTTAAGLAILALLGYA